MSLDRKILERIERENIKIRPKWFFAVKNFVFGTGAVMISILGSISLALLFDIMAQQGRNITWLSAPYLLAVLFVILLAGGYWLVTKIDSLYRVRFVPIMAILLCISLSFGYMTFASGKAEEIRLELEKIPIYEAIISKVEVPEVDIETIFYQGKEDEQQEINRDNEDEEGRWDHKDKSVSESEEDDSEIESGDEKDHDRDVYMEKGEEDDIDDELQEDGAGKENDAVEDGLLEREGDDQEKEDIEEAEKNEDYDGIAGGYDASEAEDDFEDGGIEDSEESEDIKEADEG